MSKLIYEAISEKIAGAKHILLLTDERIDGDTMGATMGLFHVLTDLQKQVTVFSPKPLPAMFSFLPMVHVIRRDEAVFQDPTIDLAIICDCSDGEYIKDFLPRLPKPTPLICMDHHVTNPNYGLINLIEPDAASTADVAYRFVKSAGYPISQQAAQCFMTGVCTDTFLFSTANTNATAMEIGSELLKKGADMLEISKKTLMNKTPAQLRLWGIALSRLFHDSSLNATATAITQQDLIDAGATDDDIGSLSEYLNEVLDESHEVVLVLYEKKDGSVKGSFRSRSRDVAALAESFGGGGHKLAAAFRTPSAKLIEHNGHWRIEKV